MVRNDLCYMLHFWINLNQIKPWGILMMNKLHLTYVKEKKDQKDYEIHAQCRKTDQMF